MTDPTVVVETLFAPAAYGLEQLNTALLIAAALQRGKLVLLEPPRL